MPDPYIHWHNYSLRTATTTGLLSFWPRPLTLPLPPTAVPRINKPRFPWLLVFSVIDVPFQWAGGRDHSFPLLSSLENRLPSFGSQKEHLAGKLVWLFRPQETGERLSASLCLVLQSCLGFQGFAEVVAPIYAALQFAGLCAFCLLGRN
jgi:hypothetical protein